MPAFIDLTGLTFGRLTALASTRRRIRGKSVVFWRCKCACGRETNVGAQQLRRGRTGSCGCARQVTAKRMGLANTTHGRTKTREYGSWHAMLQRCFKVNSPNYRWYGGRGIGVCYRWRASFLAFLADMGPRPAGMTLDRIDPHADYSPWNCRWATYSDQRRNQRRMRAAA